MRTNNYSSMLFSKAVPLLVLLFFSTGSAAQVFKCVDKATGKTSFTDKACPDKTPGAHIPVSNTNSDAGYNPSATANEKLNRDAADNARRAGAQAQVAEVQKRENAIRDKRERERREYIDDTKVTFEESMSKKGCFLSSSTGDKVCGSQGGSVTTYSTPQPQPQDVTGRQ